MMDSSDHEGRSPDLIQNVTVLGLGTMGHGIAQAFASAGCKVRCFDESADASTSLKTRIERNLLQRVRAGLDTEDSIRHTLDRIHVSPTEKDALEETRFVTEAVREDLPAKQELFPRIEAHVAPETILSSNTSSFPMSQIGQDLKRPGRALVTHWFNPPHIVPLVEVVPSSETDPETVRDTLDLLKRIGKLPVPLNRETTGFLINRIQVAMFREIWNLLDEGVATPEDVDRAVRASLGFRLAAIGPLAIKDFAGLDVTSKVYENLVTELKSDTDLPHGLRDLVAEGRHGIKTCAGIYDYTPSSVLEVTAERDRRYLDLIKLFYPTENTHE
jgi:3-hydroxybutyryl-CoA dehydrogenase